MSGTWIRASRKSRVRRVAGAMGSVAALAAVLTGCPSNDNNNGSRDPQRYQKMVNAFYSGVVALSANDPDRAHANLKSATELYPNEPAAWANLGISYLRAARLKEAGEALERARKLAPESSEILVVSALWEDAQGRPEKAAEHLRKAGQLDPGNIRAHYLLAKQLERLATPGSDTEIEALYTRIVEAQPENLIVLVELARRAARDGDREKLRQRLDQLAAVSGGWPPEVKERLQGLLKQAAAAEPRSLTVGVQMLGNVLKGTRQYQPSVAALGAGDAKTVGTPIERFLKLQQPVSTPAPRDESLAFTPEPLAQGKAAWAVTRLLQPEQPSRAGQGGVGGEAAPAETPGASTRRDAPPTLIYPRAAAVVLEGGQVLPFPGPSSPAAPQGVLSVDWNDDFRPDFVLAGPKGVRLFQQGDAGKWTDVTPKSGLPA
ncbi:MAG: tetratricopeptide repeat protein, partial [Actinomycetota bacterium]